LDLFGFLRDLLILRFAFDLGLNSFDSIIRSGKWLAFLLLMVFDFDFNGFVLYGE